MSSNQREKAFVFTIGSIVFVIYMLAVGAIANTSADSHSNPDGTLYASGHIQPRRVVNTHSPTSIFGGGPAAGRLNALNPAELDSVISTLMAQYHIPGLAACVVYGGELVWNNAFGIADVNQGVPVTDSTLFMIASTSKTVVAAAVMQLWEDGIFAMDDDINGYLPFSVNNPFFPGVPITFRMLLAHTSSIAYNDGAWLPLVTWGVIHRYRWGSSCKIISSPVGRGTTPRISIRTLRERVTITATSLTRCSVILSNR